MYFHSALLEHLRTSTFDHTLYCTQNIPPESPPYQYNARILLLAPPTLYTCTHRHTTPHLNNTHTAYLYRLVQGRSAHDRRVPLPHVDDVSRPVREHPAVRREGQPRLADLPLVAPLGRVAPRGVLHGPHRGPIEGRHAEPLLPGRPAVVQVEGAVARPARLGVGHRHRTGGVETEAASGEGSAGAEGERRGEREGGVQNGCNEVPGSGVVAMCVRRLDGDARSSSLTRCRRAGSGGPGGRLGRRRTFRWPLVGTGSLDTHCLAQRWC